MGLFVGLAAGCGGGSPTGPGETTPPDFDFGPNNPRLVSAFGDSITFGSLGERRRRISKLDTSSNYPSILQNMLRGQDPAWRVINRGLSGERTPDGRERLSGVLAADHPGFVLIMEGTNDADRGDGPASILANLDTMVARAQANKTIPIIGTLPPNFRNDPGAQGIIAQANTQIRSLAQSRRITLAEIFNGMNDRSLFGSPERGIEDPLHPNERGYAVMAGIWFNAMRQAIPPPPSAPTPPVPPPSDGAQRQKTR
ncbi:MAG TPA: SGNH/GDSL hydrolase family protein [Methylomirabilota bacterium]|nr:SGNH/GDSL hydrolase family protein [Methylomirabilota bacterium]